MALQRIRDRDPRLVALDIAETLLLLLVPAAVVGLGLALVGETSGLLTGLFVGGILGSVLARARWLLQAVRTDDGIRREPRPMPNSPVQLDYDERYDTLLAVVLVFVGVGAAATFLFADLPTETSLWVVVLGVLSWTAALLVAGARSTS